MTLRVRDATVLRRLHPVSLAVERGVLTCVVGENGAGKSTLLDVLAGILRPDTGDVCLEDVPLAQLSPRTRAQRIASLGSTMVDLDATAGERIAHGLTPRRGTTALLDNAAIAQVHAVAAELGIAHVLERDVLTLSHGERRRVDLARALVDDGVDAYVLDEPHAAVDVKHQARVSEALKARARAGKIVLVSVHDLGLAAAIADVVIGVKDGRVVVAGPPGEAFTPAAIEKLYGIAGARVVCEPEGVAVLLPRGSER